MRPTDEDTLSPADRREQLAEILARGVARLLTPPGTPAFSAGRSLANLAEPFHSELASRPEKSVTVHAG
jgi:hypothetical protein